MRFFLLDKITEWRVGAAAAGVKNIALSEDFFADHFPKFPIMPGVLILEGLAQLSGLLLEASVEKAQNRKVKALLSMIEKVKFRQIARPGDTLHLQTTITAMGDEAGKTKVLAKVGDTTIAESDMMFTWVTLDDPELEKQRRQMLEFWLRDLPHER